MRLFVFAVLTLTAQPPIVFVHGSGDDAAKWMSILWLFESNGYPREKLRAVRFTNPSARLNDAKFEAHRSSTTDQAAELSAAVTRMLIDTKSPKVALIGSSRGGNTIRNYIKNGGGAAVVSHAILAGTPNHGVFITGANTNNEFNGNSSFLTQLNQGGETVSGVRYMTTRSDTLDKYAQPNGGGYDSPMLKGAENVVLPALDHREVAFRPEAFRVMYRFLTGSEPATLKVIGEFHPRIGGLVTGFAGGAATNLPEPGVRLRIFAVNGQTGQRESPAVLETITSADGVWGPLEVQGDRNFEFELEKNESSIRYFRSPFPRSSEIVNLRFRPVAAANTLAARPQGYWAKDRDLLTFNGEPVVNVPSGLPTSDTIPLHVTTGGVLELRGERIAIRPANPPNKEIHVADFNWD
jgi:pimeloyl-ACP methyl ester carboxylesterase